MIRRLRIKNFKSFVDEDVRFGRFSLLYGANGVGKSNLTDALRLLRAIGEGRSIRDAIEGHASAAGGPTAAAVAGIRGGAKSLTHFGSSSPTFELEVEIDAREGPVTYLVAVNTDEYKVEREELRHPGHSYVFSTHPEGALLRQQADSPVILARYYKNSPGRNPSRSFSAHEFILTQFTGRKAETVANERWAEIARNALRAISPLELRPDVLRQYAPLGRFELGEHGENFAAVVWDLLVRADIHFERSDTGMSLGFKPSKRIEIPEEDEQDGERRRLALARLQAICSWLAQLTPRPIDGIAVEVAPTSEVIFSVYEAPYSSPLTARILSDGTLRVAALATALLGDDSQVSFVIEEIENGINPSRAQLVLRLIESATKAARKQVIATTHAPVLLDFLSEELRASTLVVGWDADGATSVVTPLLELEGLENAEAISPLSELLTEGWVQMAADR